MFLSYGSQLCVPIKPFELTVTCREKAYTHAKLLLFSMNVWSLSWLSFICNPYESVQWAHQDIWALDDEGAVLVLWYHCLDQRKAVTYHLSNNTHTHTHTGKCIHIMNYLLNYYWDHDRTWEYFKAHLHKWTELFELLKDIQGHSVQAGLPPRHVLSWHTRRMRFLVGDRSTFNRA